MILPFLEYGMLLVLVISGVPLVLSTVASLLLALFQAATQIQEQSLGFLLKMGVVVAVLVFGGGAMTRALLEYFRWTFESVRFLGV